MKRKNLLLCLALVLSIATAVSGTLAYLTDTETASNVMTVGSVGIVLHEQERTDLTQADSALQTFADDKPLYPAVVADDFTAEGGALWTSEQVAGVVDKIVTVENDGTSDAFFRTVVAFQKLADMDMLKVNWNDDAYEVTGPKGEFTYDGKTYVLYEAVYTANGGVLAPGATSEPSLLQVYLDPQATNETLASIGTEYTIRVGAQAVQTTNFSGDAAKALKAGFGDISGANHPWADLTNPTLPDVKDETTDNGDGTTTTTKVVEIRTAAELVALAQAVNSGADNFGGKTVRLMNDINLDGVTWTPIGEGNNAFIGIFDGQGHTIRNLEVDTRAKGDVATGLFGTTKGGVLKNVTIDGAKVTGHHWAGALVGYCYSAVDNCHVINATVLSTHLDNDACGDKAGALIGQVPVDSSSMITNCSAKDSTVTAGRDAGQLAGFATTNRLGEGNSAENVVVKPTGDCYGVNVRNELIGRQNDETDESKDSILLISTAADLKAFASQVNSGDQFSNKVVKLTKDIDLKNELWTPIGVVGTPQRFNGIFDGAGHTIFNLRVDNSNQTVNTGAGLFGCLEGSGDVAGVSYGKVLNLTIDGADITGKTGDEWAAILIGYANGNATIENVTVKNGTVNGGYDVAALVGMANIEGGTIVIKDSSVQNVKLNATTKSPWFSSYCVGALVGLNQLGTVDATGSTFSNVTVTAGGSEIVAAPVGYSHNNN